MEKNDEKRENSTPKEGAHDENSPNTEKDPNTTDKAECDVEVQPEADTGPKPQNEDLCQEQLEKIETEDEKVSELKEEICRLTELLEEKDGDLSEYRQMQERYIKQLKRMQADFTNFKRRMEREKERIADEANMDLLKKLLPVLDNFERACFAEDSSPEDGFASGVRMVYRQFMEILTEEGLEKIPAEGEEFDPNLHEAVMQVDSDDHDTNEIVEELETGYRFKDRVIRASKVKVAS